jgi:dimethylaniline monooxygenase (N-oxide forming)
MSVVPMKKHGMVPEHSFFQAMTSCLLAILPENFYNKVDEGSIVLKKAKTFNFCRDGVILEGENTPIKSDIVIFATGFRGDFKLKDIFKSSFFRDIAAGSQSSTVPLYRLVKDAVCIFIFWNYSFNIIRFMCFQNKRRICRHEL